MTDETTSVTDKIKDIRKRKPHPVRIIILILMFIATICAYVLHDYIFGDKSVFRNNICDFGLINTVWKAIPQIINTLQVVTIVLVIATLFMIIFEKIMSKSQRGITIARLVNSFIKWIVAVVLIIIVLAIWGVNTTALITGAGVLTLVIGLGMQSLIADVVAGLFIVFENEFNVGDIITVGDFRGEVVSIGIRTTKLEAKGNLKIINNNDIKEVLNQTYKLSIAYSYVEVHYEDKLPELEKIIAENLDTLEIPGVVGKVNYDGVDEFCSSGVRLQFTASCKEQDIFAVRRAVNKAIKVMFDENGIDIPYTQLVLHNPEDSKSSFNSAKSTTAANGAKSGTKKGK